jgi:hypothetical protein
MPVADKDLVAHSITCSALQVVLSGVCGMRMAENMHKVKIRIAPRPGTPNLLSAQNVAKVREFQDAGGRMLEWGRNHADMMLPQSRKSFVHERINIACGVLKGLFCQ